MFYVYSGLSHTNQFYLPCKLYKFIRPRNISRPSEQMQSILSLLEDAVKFSFLSRLKTNNIVLDTILSTIALSGISYLVKLLYLSEYSNTSSMTLALQLKSLVYKKQSITIEGRKTMAQPGFSRTPLISMAFSNRFKAVWHYLLKTMDENPTIGEIKEVCNMITTISESYLDKDASSSSNSEDHNLFIVSQRHPFLFNKELQIYAVAKFDSCDEDGHGEHGGRRGETNHTSMRVERMSITLYSFHCSLSEIREFLQKITNEYLIHVEETRRNKKFIYTLSTTKYTENKYECWMECPFESTRTFQNMFFDGKEEALSKIDFFLKNKEWYYEMGIPYTLGVGLHGEPGTGKTSFIKALANKTGRHIIVLSLQMIKTRKQLTDFWYEMQYNSHNKRGSVDFSSKIIVIEDIDCAGDIVLKRFHKQRQSKKDKDREQESKIYRNSEDDDDRNNDNNNTTKKKLKGELVIVNPVEQEDPIHLDDILNVIDGIRETPGRILVMTSNHYDKLDEALVRPGRIDLTISLSKVSKKVVSEMYAHYNKSPIPKSVLSKIREKEYTPAEAMTRIVQKG